MRQLFVGIYVTFYWPMKCLVEKYQQGLALQNLIVTKIVSMKTGCFIHFTPHHKKEQRDIAI